MQRLVAGALAALLAGCASVPHPPTTRRDELDAMKSRFTARAAELGGGLLFDPELREWTRPSLTTWLPRERAVAYPKWEEVSSGDRQWLAAWTGSAEDARRLFTWTYRWLFVAREIARAIDDINGAPEAPAAAERAADDLAVSFLRGEPRGQERLDQLEKALRVFWRRVRAPADADARFDAECGEKPFEFERCAPGELRLAYESVILRDSLDFDLQLDAVRRRREVAKAAGEAATAAARAAGAASASP